MNQEWTVEVFVTLMGVKFVVYAAVSFILRRLMPRTKIEKLCERGRRVNRRLNMTNTVKKNTPSEASSQDHTHILNSVQTIRNFNETQQISGNMIISSNQHDDSLSRKSNNYKPRQLSESSGSKFFDTPRHHRNYPKKFLDLNNNPYENSIENSFQNLNLRIEKNNNMASSLNIDLNNNVERMVSREERPAKKWQTNLIENLLFKIVFDIFTPRPHFIILFKHSSDKKQINQLDEKDVEQMLELVNLFREKFRLTNENMILSFHTGYWASRGSEFHAHLSVDENVYLRVFNETDNEGFKSFRWIANKNSNWKFKPMERGPVDQLYIKNVRNYKITNKTKTSQYQANEINIIKQNRFNWTHESLELSQGFEIEYDMNEPKIHIRCSNPVQKEVSLIKEMSRIADQQGYFEKTNGCHICLKIETSSTAIGYIRVAADTFYKLHPNPDTFLENFSNHKDFYIAT